MKHILAALLILCCFSTTVFSQTFEYTTDALKRYEAKRASRVGNTYWYAPGAQATANKILFSDQPTVPRRATFQVKDVASFTVTKYIPGKQYGLRGFYQVKFQQGKTGYIQASDFDLHYTDILYDTEWSDKIYPRPPEMMK